MIQVVDIPASFYPRKAFKFDNDVEKEQYTNFKVGIRVLPADLFNNETVGMEYYYKSSHSPYEKGHMGTGGIKCNGSDGSVRTFFLDSVIVHPNTFTMRNDNTQIEYNGEQMKKRGRKRKLTNENINENINIPKRGRGRKPLSEEERSKRETEKQNKLLLNPDRKRGRRKLSDEERMKRQESKHEHISKGVRGKGRPPKNGIKSETKQYVKTGKPRGRPKKPLSRG